MSVEKIVDFLREFGVLIAAVVVGGVVLIYGLWGVVGERASVEIVKGGKSSDHSPIAAQGSELGSGEQVTVDVAGAVEKPGVYKLPNGSRIGDVLVMAGGLGEKADREWVSKTLNLAEVVKDAQKIYIPNVLYKDDPSQIQNKGSSLGVASNKININTASLEELDGLTGIGPARAKLILDNRPYSKVDDLVTKAKIPQSVYEKIKDLVSIY